MKTQSLIVSLFTTLCLVACSKQDASSGKSKNRAPRLVPATAAEVMASTDFNLEHTTKSGIKCYVRPVTPEVAKSISEDSPDHKFLTDDEKAPYLLVTIRDNKIVELNTAEAFEVTGFLMKKMIDSDPELKKALQDGPKKP